MLCTISECHGFMHPYMYVAHRCLVWESRWCTVWRKQSKWWVYSVAGFHACPILSGCKMNSDQFYYSPPSYFIWFLVCHNSSLAHSRSGLIKVFLCQCQRDWCMYTSFTDCCPLYEWPHPRNSWTLEPLGWWWGYISVTFRGCVNSRCRGSIRYLLMERKYKWYDLVSYTQLGAFQLKCVQPKR